MCVGGWVGVGVGMCACQDVLVLACVMHERDRVSVCEFVRGQRGNVPVCPTMCV